MSQLSTPQSILAQTLAQYGVRQVSDLSTSRIRPYTELFGGPTPPTIATGNTATLSIKVDNGSVFIANRVYGTVVLAGALSSSVAGTPLPYLGDPDSGSNELPSLAHIRVQFRANNGLFSRHPLPANLVLGHAGRQLFSENPWVLTPGQELFVDIINGSAVSIVPWITLGGTILPST